MFAIRITPDNMEKILARHEVNRAAKDHMEQQLIPNGREYYAITGYYSSRNGRVTPFAILPGFIFKKVFVYDEDVIETDWDQIVRKDENAST